MTTSAHVAQCAAQAKPLFNLGYSFMTLFITSLISSGAGFGMGWYIKGRGMTGVKIDLQNVKTDVENLKAKIGQAA